MKLKNGIVRNTKRRIMIIVGRKMGSWGSKEKLVEHRSLVRFSFFGIAMGLFLLIMSPND